MIRDNNVRAQFSLAGLLSSAGRLDEAAQAARSAIVFSGSSPPAAFALRLSQIELARRNMPEALHWARQAIMVHPADIWANQQLSTVLQRTGDLNGAAAAAAAAIAGAGASVPAAFMQRLSEVRVEQGDKQAALVLARQAVQAEPENPWTNYHLARLSLSLSKLGEAQSAAEAAIAHADPRWVGSFQRTLSQVHQARKEFDDALTWARLAVQADESDTWSQSHLAGLLLNLGDLDGAEHAARKALIASSASGLDQLTDVLRQVQARRERMLAKVDDE